MSGTVDYSNSPGASARGVVPTPAGPTGATHGVFDANGVWKWYPERCKMRHTILLDCAGVWGLTRVKVDAVYHGSTDATDGYVHELIAAAVAKTRQTFEDKIKYFKFTVSAFAGVTVTAAIQDYNEPDVGKAAKVGTP